MHEWKNIGKNAWINKSINEKKWMNAEVNECINK